MSNVKCQKVSYKENTVVFLKTSPGGIMQASRTSQDAEQQVIKNMNQDKSTKQRGDIAAMLIMLNIR